MRSLAQMETTESAYHCDPCVRQIFKLKREGEDTPRNRPQTPGETSLADMPHKGQFCGYRNIQMLASYIVASGSPGSEHLQGRIPSIFDLQDAIESAWRRGIRPEGLIETGGIKGTRKFIGTPEAEALFTSLEIP